MLATQSLGELGLKMEVLKVLVKLILEFGKLVAAHVPRVLGAAWAMFLHTAPLYHTAIITHEVDLEFGEVRAFGSRCETL